MERIITTTLNSEEFHSLIYEAVKDAAEKVMKKEKEAGANEQFLNQRDAAKFLHISLPTIIRWKKENKIPYYQEGRTALFKKSELLQVLQKNESLLR